VAWAVDERLIEQRKGADVLTTPEFLSQPATDDESDQRPEVPLEEIVRRTVDGLDMVRRAAAELARRAALAARE
jgi:hypothetical protein